VELTREFAKMITKTSYEDFSEEEIAIAKERILDTIGAWIAGYMNWEFKQQLLDACEIMGTGDSNIIGCADKKYPLAVAAMANASFAHAMELDDGHKNAGVHAGAVIVPTAFTLGAQLNSSPKDIITAVVLGYEIVYRIAVNINPAQLKKGFHPSATCDTYGAMAVSAKLMGLNRKQCANGFGLAGVFASGLMEATRSGRQTKCVMVGNAALSGIYAAQLAAQNIIGPTFVLEGVNGMFSAMSENVNVDMILNGLGKNFLIKDTYTKLYPTCRHSHVAIEATIELVVEQGIKPKDIERIEVGTYQVAKDLTGAISTPRDAGEAKFSMPYCLAVAVYEKYFGICHLSSNYLQQDIYKAMARRVNLKVDDEINNDYPKIRASKVKIVLKNGYSCNKYLSVLKGSPDKPVSWDDLLKKFRGATQGFLSDQSITEISDIIKHLEGVKNVLPITSKIFTNQTNGAAEQGRII